MAGRKRTKRYGLEGIVDNGGFLHLSDDELMNDNDSDRDSDFDLSGSEFESDDSSSHLQPGTASASQNTVSSTRCAASNESMLELSSNSDDDDNNPSTSNETNLVDYQNWKSVEQSYTSPSDVIFFWAKWYKQFCKSQQRFIASTIFLFVYN